MKRFILFIILFFLFNACFLRTYADGIDSLTLSNEEMQKLKKFFPVPDEEPHIKWKGDPIPIQLPLGKEKRLVFPAHVTVDVKGKLNSDQLSLLNNDKSVYFKALSNFATTRIFITLDTGKVLLVDISTSDSATQNVQYIDIEEHIKSEIKETKQGNNIATTSVNEAIQISETLEDKTDDVSHVDLIRFAWQEMYAPKRISKHSKYARAPMHTEKFVSNLIYGDKVISHPVASWTSGGFFVSAVALQNKYAHSTHIDIRKDICGLWLAATIYPAAYLKPHGMRRGDSTTLFLVSQKPFAEVLGVCNGNA